MMSKIRIGFAVAMVGALAACHSGVKLDEGANKGAIGTNPTRTQFNRSMSTR